MMLITLPGLWCDGVRVQFLPLVQLVVKGHRHGIALVNLVVTHGGDTILVEKAVSAVHAFEKTSWMMAPMEKVGA